MSLSLKCICPSCFNEINLAMCKIVSGKTSGKILKDPSKKFLAGLRGVEPLSGHEYTLEQAHRQCYICNYLLPENIESVPSITLAVVGDLFSGKSLYIASLIHQLKHVWAGDAAGFTRFDCLTDDVQDDYTKRYMDPLFNQKRVLAATQAGKSQYARPLIYRLVVNSPSRQSRTAANLMIYDTSGEDFESRDRFVDYARFALTTSAFIFIADPFTMEPFIHNLDPIVRNAIQGRRAAERLNAIISTYERYHSLPNGSSLPRLPIAVMLSKSDMFLPQNQPANYAFARNPNYSNGFDLNDIDAVDQEVRNLLIQHQQRDLINATGVFRQSKFFATSATGTAADVNGNFASVDPCRCLDPVLWILYQLGILRASK